MSEDLYTTFLGIPPGPRPPKAHVLLGVGADVSDPEIIEAAAHRQMDELDRYALSDDRAVREKVQRLMNEVAKARVQLIRQVDQTATKAKAKKVPTRTTPTPTTQSQPSPQARPERPEPIPARRTRQRTKKAKPLFPSLSAEAWSIVAVAWLTSLLLTAMITYMLVPSAPDESLLASSGLSGQTQPAKTVEPELQPPAPNVNQPSPAQPVEPPTSNPQPTTPDAEPASEPEVQIPEPVTKEPTPTPLVEPAPTDQEKLAEDPEPGPQDPAAKPDEPAEAPVLTAKPWEQILKIQDRDEQLASYINLRDSLRKNSPEQINLVQQAMNEFNGLASTPLNIKSFGGRTDIRVVEDESHANNADIAVTDLSALTDFSVDDAAFTKLKHVKDFDVIRTMRISKLMVNGCPGLTDLRIISDVKGLRQLLISESDFVNLEGLQFTPLLSLELYRNKELKSLDGLQGLSFSHFHLSGSEQLVDLSALGGVKKLERVVLWHLNTDDLSFLKGLSLTSVTLYDCRKLSSIETLYAIDTLENVSLNGCKNVPKSQIEKLQQLYPGLKITQR